MQIPILNGIFTDSTPELRTSYPVNLVPVPKQSGISNGFLRPGDGIVANGTGPGIDRGGINWQGNLYRVMGTKLVEIDSIGAVTVLGDVGGPTDQLVTFDYSFGFAPISTIKQSPDYDSQSTSDEFRVSWVIDKTLGGRRLGSMTNLQSSDQYYKMMFLR
jgi:hypothetical protein